MNNGTIINRALSRRKLAIKDVGFRDMALEMLDEVIQYFWNYQAWKFRVKQFTLAMVIGQEEYPLDKRIVNYSDILKYTLQGSNPVRYIKYEPSQEFNRTHPFELSSGDPYRWRPGQVNGFSLNPSAASVITLVSSLTNYTTGTAAVVNGQNRVVFTTSVLTQNMLGLWIRFASDQRAYRLNRRDFGSSTIYYLDDLYEGVSGAGVAFVIGDVQQKATVSGYLVTSGQYAEEEVQLAGSTPVSTVQQFTSLVRISKSGITGGYITATSNSSAVTNAILSPGETDLNILTINFYPIPSKVETINMESAIAHPFMVKESDSPLFPAQFHELLVVDLQIKIIEEWLNQEVPQGLIERRQRLLNNMVDIDNSTAGWTIQQESEEDSDRTYANNLPNNFPGNYGY